MKKNKLFIILLLFIGIIIPAQIKYYNLKEIKDTINKYDNIFSAYNALEKGTKYIDTDIIINDKEIKTEMLKLLDIDDYKKYLIKEAKKDIIQRVYSKDFDTINYIGGFIKSTNINMKDKDIEKLKKSIYNNNELYRKYLDSAIENSLSIKIDYINYDIENRIKKEVIEFLYPTQWKEVKVFVKEYCKNSKTNFCNHVLIEMNDKEYTDNYEKYFIHKLNSGTLDYHDYLFLNKIFYNKKVIAKIYLEIISSPKKYELNPFDGILKEVKKESSTTSLRSSIYYKFIRLFDIKSEEIKSLKEPNYEELIKLSRGILKEMK